MRNGPDGPDREVGDERLLALIRRSQRSMGGETPLPSEEAILAYLEDRAGAAHLEEIRDALDRRPALAGWLAEMVAARDALTTGKARERFDRASPPPLPSALLRQGREELARNLQPAQIAPRRSRLREWLFAGWAAAATATAGVLIVARLQQPPEPSPGSTSQVPNPRPSQSAPTVPVPPFRFDFLGQEFPLHLMRADLRIDTLEVEWPESVLRLTAEPPPHSPNDQSPVKVELEGPAGHRVIRQTTIAALSGPGRILVSGPSLATGRYVLSLRGLWKGASPDSTSYPFYLRVHSKP